jgi:hypothetical protein
MKHSMAYLGSAALGAALLVASGSGWAQMAAPAGQMGNYCATPTKTCTLSRASLIGSGCSCRVPGGRKRGTVASNYGYPPSAYGNPFAGVGAALTAPVAAAAQAPAAVAGAATAPFGAPLMGTGGSVATGQIGNSCTTPQKTCTLKNPSYVGIGCACRVPGGHVRGSVTP